MAVTDLTNTTWLFNDDYLVDVVQGLNYSINFISNNETFTTIKQGTFRFEGDTTSGLLYNGTPVYAYSWSNFNEAYRIIEITGGTDATNSSLISWLTANATQITSGGSMYLGTSTISKMYLGQNEVSKVYLGQDLVYEKQASLPTFTIVHPYTAEETTYQFEDGMTWLQWVNSAYNTDSYFVYPDGTKVYQSDISWITTYTRPRADINKNDLIVAGNYTLEVDN